MDTATESRKAGTARFNPFPLIAGCAVVLYCGVGVAAIASWVPLATAHLPERCAILDLNNTAHASMARFCFD
jgi:hypothetical protein